MEPAGKPKRIDDALEMSEEMTRAITGQSLFGVAIVQDRRVKYANRAVADLLGYSIEELLSFGPEQLMRLIHPDDRQIAEREALERESRGEGAVTTRAFRMITRSGRAVWVDRYSQNIRFRGAPATLTVTVDVTERRQAEAALRQSERRFRDVAEILPVGIDELDREGRIRYVNPAYCRMSGYEPSELEGSFFWDRTTDPEPLRAIYGGLMSEQPEPAPWLGQSVHKTGRVYDTRVDWDYRRDEKGEVAGLIAVISDITLQKSLEAQLRQAQKMEAIGTLAGGVAHDFNNLLTPILGYADLLAHQSVRGSRVHDAASVIKTAALRASELAGQLLGFARRGKLIDTAVDIHRVVSETVALVGCTIDKRINISLELGADRPLVTGDPGQLAQVVMNLAVNARDAMPAGGELALATANVVLDEAYCREHMEAAPGSFLRLSVRDTGTGMSAEIRQRIFEPFFTTKPEGEGTGMGLAMVYGIVRNHGGSIEVRSKLGEGTAFDLYLPLVAGAARPRLRESGTMAVPGTGTVLVVDDEDGVRRVVRSLLESLGYRVILAENGSEAIEIYRERGPEIDLVVLDLTMPVMDGQSCFDQLRTIDPEVRVVVATGHALDKAAQKLLDRGAKGFVQKPFIKVELSRVVADALERDGEPGEV